MQTDCKDDIGGILAAIAKRMLASFQTITLPSTVAPLPPHHHNGVECVKCPLFHDEFECVNGALDFFFFLNIKHFAAAEAERYAIWNTPLDTLHKHNTVA